MIKFLLWLLRPMWRTYLIAGGYGYILGLAVYVIFPESLLVAAYMVTMVISFCSGWVLAHLRRTLIESAGEDWP